MYQLKVNQQQTIVALRRQGWSKRRIARELDLDRATVRKYLAKADSKSPTPQTGSSASPLPKSPTDPQTGSSTGFGPVSSCEPWREPIERVLAQGLSIQRIHQDSMVERQFAGISPVCLLPGSEFLRIQPRSEFWMLALKQPLRWAGRPTGF
jgi:hypothetical protein